MSTTTVETKAGVPNLPATTNGHAKTQDTSALSLMLGGPSKAALAFYRRIADPLEAVNKLGTMFARSCMFGCNNDDQGRVLAMICLTEGKTPSYLLKRHHIIGGKLSDKADAMLAAFRMNGGKHFVRQYSPQVVEIEFVTPDQRMTCSFTWEEAREEAYIYTSPANDGKVKKTLPNGDVNPAALKDNWSTPRRRAQMLWARVVSDSVRHLMPEVNFSDYTADELGGNESFEGEDAYVDADYEVVAEADLAAAAGTESTAGATEPTATKAKRGRSSKAKEAPAEQAPATTTTASDSTEAAPFDGNATEASATGNTTTQLQVDANPVDDSDCLIDMPRLERLGELKAAIGYSKEDWQAKALNKFGVPTARQLTRGQADMLIRALENKWAGMQTRDDISKWADPRPEVPSREVVKN